MAHLSDIAFLATAPGCYLFRDKAGNVIYIGKAKNIRKRVSQYFQKKDHDPKTKVLVSQIDTIDYIVTTTEVEALLLENNLIKKYYPKYNLDLKDSRRYAYILLHNDEIPWIEVARTREEKGEYYGPFVSGAIRKIILDVITRNFRILTRKPSPRLKKLINTKEYSERMQQAKKILKGDAEELIAELQKKMKSSSEKTYYEHALTIRNQIEALQQLTEKQRMEMTRKVDAHIINYSVAGDQMYLLLFSIRNGVLEEKQAYNFPYYEECFEDFLLQYYDTAPVPQEVIVPHAVDSALEEYLAMKGKRKVSIMVPTKGDKKELLDLVAYNITTTFFTGSNHSKALQEILVLEKMPRHIECFDISHLGGTNTVASMVTFRDGLPDKNVYRKFKIHTALESDDYGAMKEVIYRRYAKSLSRSMKNPDLIVVDGGKGQLQVALTTLRELKLSIPIVALAKKYEEIYIPNKKTPLIIDRKNKGLQLLQAMRDEAHRFAISYQRHLRKKEIKN
ncbi:MAG: hypothetical protein RL557_267 [archaeon]|jgi:excinuclease ABC subunit C